MVKSYKNDIEEFGNTSKYLGFDKEEEYYEYIIEKKAIELIENNLHIGKISVYKLEARIQSELGFDKDLHKYFKKFYTKYNLVIKTHFSGASIKYFTTKNYKVSKRNVIINEII